MHKFSGQRRVIEDISGRKKALYNTNTELGDTKVLSEEKKVEKTEALVDRA